MRIILLYILLIPFIGHTQSLSYQEVDKQTYDSLMNGAFENVIQTGEAAINQGHDFYYLHLRMGIAYYETKQYYKAQISFEKAKALNNFDPILNKYIALNALYTGNKSLYHYHTSNGKIKITSFGTEGNLKIPSNDQGDLFWIISPHIELSFSKRLQSKFQYTYFKQNASWGNCKQYQLFSGNDFFINSKLSVQTNFHYISLLGEVSNSYKYTTEETEPGPPTPQGQALIIKTENTTGEASGNLNQSVYALYLGSTYQLKGLSLDFGFNYARYIEKDSILINENSNQTTEIKSGSNTLNKFEENFTTNELLENQNINLFQLDFNLTSRSPQNKTIYSAGISLPITSTQTGISLNGEIFKKINQKNWLGINGHYNSNYNSIENKGALIYNGVDPLHLRFGTQWAWYPKPNISFSFGISQEFRSNYYTEAKYRNTTLNGTFNYKL